LRSSRGFTLLELMVVIAIVSTVLLLVPMNLGGFGARSRLNQAGNSLVAALTSIRERAIIDGYEARLEIGLFRSEGKMQHGYRFVFTNLPEERRGNLDEEFEEEGDDEEREERTWLTGLWRALPDDLHFAGISERAKDWQNLKESDPYVVAFRADGSVHRAVAFRIESRELEVRQEYRTVTVVVNPLTSEVTFHEGFEELPVKREAHEFR
jgi:prepilin-type N-terminal cleavage/methylation domain-containing protein